MAVAKFNEWAWRARGDAGVRGLGVENTDGGAAGNGDSRRAVVGPVDGIVMGD